VTFTIASNKNVLTQVGIVPMTICTQVQHTDPWAELYFIVGL